MSGFNSTDSTFVSSAMINWFFEKGSFQSYSYLGFDWYVSSIAGSLSSPVVISKDMPKPVGISKIFY